MSDKAILLRQANEIRVRLDAIEKKERAAANAALVGKCYRFRNSSGGDEHWWLYLKVTGTGDYWPEAITFQATADRRMEIKPEHIFVGGGEYEEITQEQLAEAWRSFIAVLNTIPLP